MTGTVTWEVLIWMAGTGLFALVTGWRIVSWVLSELGKRDAEINKLEKDAGLLIGAVDSRAKLAEDELRRSLEAHRRTSSIMPKTSPPREDLRRL